jgi:hypothetical protein
MRRATAFSAAIVAAGTVLGAVPAWAHHSFAASYDEKQSITIEGNVVAFDYRNPHAWVTLNVADPQGNAVLWQAEWRSPVRLEQDGILKDTIHPGDHILITGSPGKTTEEHRIHLKTIERPSDGFKNVGMGGGGNRFRR